MREINVEKGILIDLDRCVGCHTCEAACIHGRNLSPSKRGIRMVKIGPKKIEEQLCMDFIVQLSDECNLCEHRTRKDLMPFCVISCPTDALRYCNTVEMLQALRNGKRYQVCKISET